VFLNRLRRKSFLLVNLFLLVFNLL
ncbi:hypothetical protein MPH_14082, partial [Macrophomina phaseolina MS6]